MKLKRIVAIATAAASIMSMNTVAFADTEGSTEVEIRTEATLVDVTVPSTLPIVFREDGSNTVPDNYTIQNNSMSAIHLTSVGLDAQGSGWKVIPESMDPTQFVANTRQILFLVNSKAVAPMLNEPMETGSARFDPDEVVIEPGQSVTLDFEVYRGSFTVPLENTAAFTMTTTFDFN